MGNEEVMFIFRVMPNPIKPPWPLIDRDICAPFLSKPTLYEVAILDGNFPLRVLKKCCYFSLRIEIQDA
jgi:hypothetical protein